MGKMTGIDAPPEFSSVTLRDRYTWHRATLQQWLDAREAIIKRAGDAMPWAPSSPMYARSLDRATKTLWGEEARAGRPTGVTIEGRLQDRLDQLMYEQFVSSAKARRLLTDWEAEFLDACKWLDELAEECGRDFGRRSLVGLLADWILSVEEEAQLASARRKRRAEMERAVAIKGRVRAHRGRNPYYPAPIDLLGIWRAVMVIVAWIQWKNRQLTRLEAASGVGSAASRKKKRQPRKSTGADFAGDLMPLFNSLREQGFEPAITLSKLLGWKEWKKIYQRGVSTFTTELTARIFHVKPQTVQRDLTAGVLRKEYKRYRVPKMLQDYRDNTGLVRPGVIREREWYRREPIVVEEVILGHAFFPPPPSAR